MNAKPISKYLPLLVIVFAFGLEGLERGVRGVEEAEDIAARRRGIQSRVFENSARVRDKVGGKVEENGKRNGTDTAEGNVVRGDTGLLLDLLELVYTKADAI